MQARSHARLVVLHVLVVALLLTLAGRLWYLQVLDGERYAQVAQENRVRDIVVPAVRGQILDDMGRPLVRNRTGLVVSVDRTALSRQPDQGRAVLSRLSGVLGMPQQELAARIRLCGQGVTRPCWPGSPYQPIPVAHRVDSRRGLQILERQEDFPGVSAQMQAVRDYPEPSGASTAQVLGYLQPVTQEELDRRKGLQVTGYSGVDLVGRAGLEAVYDQELRGAAGVRQVLVDSQGRVTGTARERHATAGSHLVTSIDARVQAVVEKSIAGAVKRARKKGRKADSAAGVVMDPRTGRILALASWPTYDPAIWTGGISQREYDTLLSKKGGQPLISRTFQGEFAPGSTFKVSSIAGAVNDGYDLHGTYACPGSYTIGNRSFQNFEGKAHGSMSLRRALILSCDTVFYRFAYEQWKRDGGTSPGKNPEDPMQQAARAYGFGKPTGIDVTGEAAGRIPDRKWKREFWKSTKKDYCKRARTGYPEVRDPARAAYLKSIATEQCAEGHVWRAGDSANFSVGQGEVLVTPLQLARAYAAVANGGTLFSPRIGRALVRPDGTVVRQIQPPAAGKLPVSGKVLAYMRDALARVPREGTAAAPFAKFPFGKVAVAGKTGTAEVYGKADTSWFASYAPAKKPKYVVVVMVSRSGTGAEVAAPAVRDIYEGIYGIGRGDAAFPGGTPPAALPVLRPDGTATAPRRSR